jgi:hypothetical protein
MTDGSDQNATPAFVPSRRQGAGTARRFGPPGRSGYRGRAGWSRHVSGASRIAWSCSASTGGSLASQLRSIRPTPMRSHTYVRSLSRFDNNFMWTRASSVMTRSRTQRPGPRRAREPEWPQLFKALLTNSNKAFVAGSSEVPRLASIREWLVSWAPKTLAGMPASFSTVPRRWACAEVSG